MEHRIIWKGERRPLADNNKVTMQIDGNTLEGNLPLYLDEVNHSPTGFEWGYYGSGPSQLAYAILRSYYTLGEKLSNPVSIRSAKQHYMLFKQEFVAKWQGKEWEITSDQVSFWLSTQGDGGREGWV